MLPPSPHALICWLLGGNVCYMHKAIFMQSYFVDNEPCAVLYRKLHSAIKSAVLRLLVGEETLFYLTRTV